MSAARLCTARLAPLVALAALWLVAGCTGPTPGYCNTTDNNSMEPGARVCAQTQHCNITIHHCEDGSLGVDANDASAGDVPADAAIDSGTTEDHPATTDGADGPRTDGPHTDASDASLDVFHGCVNNNGCPDSTKPVCQTDGGVCVGCLQSSDCKTAGALACDTAVNKCVECVGNGDCTDPTKPVCDKQACRGCKADSECTGIGPGVCMFHLDGHCATDSETVYVSSSPGCADKTDGGLALGTSQTPYCTSQYAIDSTTPVPVPPLADGGPGVTDGGADAGIAPDGGTGLPASMKSLVVMRGSKPMTSWSFATSNQTITVVGQSGAQISGGASIGIHVSGGTVYVRNLRVTGGNGPPGIVADGGSLHLDRSIVDGNMTGGILINNAAYDITNTVVANNGQASTGGCANWGGVCILEPAGATPGQFLNNTVIGNDTSGVTCFGPYPLLGSVIVAKGTGSATAVCTPTPCCGTGPINVDPTTFHLMAGSSCIDRLTTNMSTPYDYDGTPRPINTLSDCGAFEYAPPAGP